jgi:hypothetical protein
VERVSCVTEARVASALQLQALSINRCVSGLLSSQNDLFNPRRATEIAKPNAQIGPNKSKKALKRVASIVVVRDFGETCSP